jgi:26S proteasome regulatory subunit N6
MASAAGLQEQLDAAASLASATPAQGASAFRAVVAAESSSDAESLKVKELAITQLCDLLVKQADAKGLAALLGELRGFFTSIPKAKTAKIVRNVIDCIAKIPGSTQLQVGTQIGDQIAPDRKAYLRAHEPEGP